MYININTSTVSCTIIFTFFEKGLIDVEIRFAKWVSVFEIGN